MDCVVDEHDRDEDEIPIMNVLFFRMGTGESGCSLEKCLEKIIRNADEKENVRGRFRLLRDDGIVQQSPRTIPIWDRVEK